MSKSVNIWSSLYTNRPRLSSKDVLNEHYETCTTKSEYALQTIKEYKLGIEYGEGPSQKLDIFYPEVHKAETSLVVYYHGGYWQEGSTSLYRFLANPVTQSNNILVLVGVDIAPTGTITSIIRQCRESVGFICKMFPNTGKVTFCGHSAGGTEVAMIASTAWELFNPSVSKYFTSRQIRFVSLCGVFELNHLINTSVNEKLNMAEQEATDHSPINYVNELALNQKTHKFKIAIVQVQNESPTIAKSNLEYIKALEKASIKFHSVYMENSDHFKIIQDLSETSYSVTKILTEDHW